MYEKDHKGTLRIAANQRQEEKKYWLDKLSGEWEKTGFLPDYDTLSPKGLEEGKFIFTIEPHLSKSVMAISGGSHVRLYVVLQAALNILLYKF